MARIITYQDLMEAEDRTKFIAQSINAYKISEPYKTALIADEYDRQQNHTIMHFVKLMRTVNGRVVPDEYGSNIKLAKNFFHRLNTQRVMYSLGNGVSFVQPDEEDGEDKVKPLLGKGFDGQLKRAAGYALKHSVSFMFWNSDGKNGKVHVFPMTEFLPFWDEDTGELRAGARFWRLDNYSPMKVILYEEDGYTVYKEVKNKLTEIEPKRGYIITYQTVPFDGTTEVIHEENYQALPIVPLWGNENKQSTLLGMRENIDAYDLIKSGFANDLNDCAQVYWIIENAGGMNDEDLSNYLAKLKRNHIAVAQNADEANIKPYAQEVPHESRDALLSLIRNDIYEDFGALDVHTVAAGATNDHIDAAYQPMDEEADAFEAQITQAVESLLALQGIDDSPVFKRNRISNQKEQVEMVALEAQWLDDATILRKLPNITDEEAKAILMHSETESYNRMFGGANEPGQNQGENGEQ